MRVVEVCSDKKGINLRISLGFSRFEKLASQQQRRPSDKKGIKLRISLGLSRFEKLVFQQQRRPRFTIQLMIGDKN